MIENKTQSISVVVPVYKTNHTLGLLVERLIPVLTLISKEYEIIFVDDGDQDQSWGILRQLSERYEFVRSLRLSRNYGQHNAILCGVCESKGEIIITMDDDLQHPPEVLPELIAALTPDVDVVYGSPKQANHSFFRNLSSKLTKVVLQGVMGADNALHVSALRAFRRRISSHWGSLKSPLVNIDVMLTWVTSRFTYVRVMHAEREDGQSGYTFKMLVKHAFNLITGFSNLPLQLASIIGFIFAGFGFLILFYVVAMWIIQEDTVPGFAFLASIISIFSGIQLLSIGVMGEYISRVFERMSEKPKYTIKESSNTSKT